MNQSFRKRWLFNFDLANPHPMYNFPPQINYVTSVFKQFTRGIIVELDENNSKPLFHAI